MRLRLIRGAIGALLVILPTTAQSADAATTRLTVTGKVKGSEGQNLAVLLVGNDGSSVRTPVSPNGSFTATVSPRIVSSFRNGTPGKGPTLHIVQNGKYAGPVVLGKKNATTGYARLSSTKNGTVSVGTIAMKTGYSVASAKATVIDKKASIRMKTGKPVSSGSVREAAVFGPVHSFDTVVADTTVIGADSDRDGLPNFADPDLNGDGVLDAAQPDPSSQFANSTGVLPTRRPGGRFGFQKIIENPEFVQVNSNANPSVTQDQILSYLSRYMSIEMLVGLSSSEMSGVTVLVDCRKLSYCSPGSKSMIRGTPGDGNDGKELATLQNADGLLVMPDRAGENTKLLRFYPGAASATEAALTGDVFELLMQQSGVTTYSEVRVVTSSFVTPMAVATFNDTPVNLLAHQKFPGTVDPTRIALTFYRPQSFAAGSTSQLVDRGGMSYVVRAWPSDGSNKHYFCSADALTSLSPTLVKGTDTAIGGGVLFDSEQSPAANGTKLAVTVDFTKCVNKESGKSAAPAKGEPWWIEIEAQDSDWNRARISVDFTVG